VAHGFKVLGSSETPMPAFPVLESGFEEDIEMQRPDSAMIPRHTANELAYYQGSFPAALRNRVFGHRDYCDAE